MKRGKPKPVVVTIGRWHIGEAGFAVEEVCLSSNGLWWCSCATWRQQVSPEVKDCRHILKARGVKNSQTIRLFFTVKTAEGIATAPETGSQKPEPQKHSGPIRKVEL